MARPGATALILALATTFVGGSVLPAPADAAPRTGAASTPSPASAARGTAAPVREEPCPDSEFTCVTLAVPRDHFSASGGPTLDVTFAIHRATRSPRKGVFVTVTGGPGTSGIAAADGYTSAFDPALVADYDIVFLDQRGVGLSEPLQCPDAALAFYDFPGDPAQDLAHGLAYARAARRFAHDCVGEAGVARSALPFFSTRQAVEDLEAFRAWLRAPKLDLYGESYGTQYVQTYAAAHPDRLHSLFVDGPVDLTLTGNDYYVEDAHAFDAVLSMTLDRCTGDEACRADALGRDALRAYDRLARELRVSPRRYAFTRADGRIERRTFTIGDLESAAAGYVYSTYDRMLLGRALAQAVRGQLAPLARLAFLSLGQDPETLDAIPDPSWSDAMFYAVECTDYDYRSGSPAESALAYLQAGRRARMDRVRLGSVFYGDLPCAYWAAHPQTAERPAPLTDTPYPVFVLASTTDPATPYAGALRIYRRLSDAYLIVQPGGPHIIFGRGNACPDELVTAFLVDGTRPAHRRTTCDDAYTDPYVPLPAARVTSRSDALATLAAVDDELTSNADYWAWDGADPLRLGCLYGGRLRYAPTDAGASVGLHDCRLSRGLPLTGRGSIDWDTGAVTLRVRGPSGTRLVYTRDADGNRSVTGTWFGRRVDDAVTARAAVRAGIAAPARLVRPGTDRRPRT
jgi:pimeloyl-ACP methyl ester carboxylesterase